MSRTPSSTRESGSADEHRRNRVHSSSRSSRSTGGLWREAWFRLRRNPSAIVGAIFVLTFVVVAIFAPLIAPYPPEEIPVDLPATCCPGPSCRALVRHERGRAGHVLAHRLRRAPVAHRRHRLGHRSGSRSGCSWARSRATSAGFVDSVIMRLMDMLLAIPGLLLAIGIVALELPIPTDLPDHGRDRGHEHPDLRAAVTRVDPCPAGQRLRARGAGRSACAAARSCSRTSFRTRSGR